MQTAIHQSMKGHTLTVILALSLASCSSGDGGSDSVDSAPGNASPAGIWHGTEMESGLHILALIDETGDLRLIRDDNLQYVGTANVSGATVSGVIESYTDRGTTFSDGSAHGTGSISGSLNEKQTLRVVISYQTDNGTASTTYMTLTYDAFYETPSSLAAVAGTYIEAIKGTVFVVDSSGNFSARDASTGCMVDGAVSLLNPNHNIYELSYSYSSCNADAAALDGVVATGKSIFTDAGVGAQVLAATSYSVSGQKVGLVVELNRSDGVR